MNTPDVMVSNVITIRPNNTVQDIAALLPSNRISGLPAPDQNGALTGIICEGDLKRRVETGTEQRRS